MGRKISKPQLIIWICPQLPPKNSRNWGVNLSIGRFSSTIGMLSDGEMRGSALAAEPDERNVSIHCLTANKLHNCRTDRRIMRRFDGWSIALSGRDNQDSQYLSGRKSAFDGGNNIG